MPNVICPCGFSVPKGTKCDCRAKRSKERQQANDAARPSAAARGYDGDWRRVRGAYLKAHPTCSVEHCGERATEVDHIQSIAGAPRLRLQWSNLRSFCKPHHSARTARDQAFGRAS